MDIDTYTKPPHGWTCFHCGETFTTPGGAEVHFGAKPIATPGCQIKVGEERGLLMALRKAEEELERYRAQDSEIERAMYKQQAAHLIALMRAEEQGYARGLKDARNDS